MKSQPLADTELDHLSAVLERFGDKRSMNLEQLDGFLAALICGPELVPPSKYLPKIWGDQTVFEDASSAQEFLSLIMRHWNAIADTLNSGEVYLPLLLEDESGIAHGNDWANGFLRGMEFGKEDWALLLDDEDYGGSLVAIFALANENNPDPEMRSYKDPISADLRERSNQRGPSGNFNCGSGGGNDADLPLFQSTAIPYQRPAWPCLTSSARCQRLDGTICVHADRVKNSSSAVARPPCIRPILYSSRSVHTYATFRLHEGVNQYALARNMGTSVQMLETFYGHTTNRTMATELTKNKGKQTKALLWE